MNYVIILAAVFSTICIIQIVEAITGSTKRPVIKDGGGGTVHFDHDEIYVKYPMDKDPQFIPNHPIESSPAVGGQNEVGRPGGSQNYIKEEEQKDVVNKMQINNSINGGVGHSHQYAPTYGPQHYVSESTDHSVYPQNSGVPQDNMFNRVNTSPPPNRGSNGQLFPHDAPINVHEVMQDKNRVKEDSRLNNILRRGLMQMTLDLERSVRKFQPNSVDNVVVAPISIVGALALLLLGSDGETKRELEHFMGIATGKNLENKSDLIHKVLSGFFDTLHQKPGVKIGADINFANGIFFQEKLNIKDIYKQLAKDLYGSEVYEMDFTKSQSADFINKWVSNRTKGRIPNIIPGALNSQISIVLANVVYFNGKWEYPFDIANNLWDTFEYHTSRTEKKVMKIELMANMEKVEYFNDREREFQILGLPYQGGEVVIYYILPKTSDLESFMSNIDHVTLRGMMNSTKLQEVIYAVPKMKVQSNIELRPVLSKLGLSSMFDIRRADLSHMFERTRGGACIDQVFHKVNIDINEEGTVAAASTGIIVTRISKPTIKVNKPFIFFIYHKTIDTILFWASINKPDPFE